MEWQDFQTMWEERFLEVAEPFLDPSPALVEGSRLAQWEDGSMLVVVVEVGREYPQRSGFYECEVIVEYDYRKTGDPEAVSRTWGQILEAFGDGHNGGAPLRGRLPSGRLRLIKGLASIQYDRGMSEDPEEGVKSFALTAYLGVLPLPALSGSGA